MVSCVVLIGLIIYAYYSTCDPVLAELVKKKDGLIPMFVMKEFASLPGIAGACFKVLFWSI